MHKQLCIWEQSTTSVTGLMGWELRRRPHPRRPPLNRRSDNFGDAVTEENPKQPPVSVDLSNLRRKQENGAVSTCPGETAEWLLWGGSRRTIAQNARLIPASHPLIQLADTGRRFRRSLHNQLARCRSSCASLHCGQSANQFRFLCRETRHTVLS